MLASPATQLVGGLTATRSSARARAVRATTVANSTTRTSWLGCASPTAIFARGFVWYAKVGKWSLASRIVAIFYGRWFYLQASGSAGLCSVIGFALLVATEVCIRCVFV
jgi:hypothetical protein